MLGRVLAAQGSVSAKELMYALVRKQVQIFYCNIL